VGQHSTRTGMSSREIKALAEEDVI